jgi:hypothetical protein
MQIPSGHLPEGFDYFLEQLAEDIGKPLEIFERGLPH